MTVSLVIDQIRVKPGSPVSFPGASAGLLEVDYVLANQTERDLYIYNLLADEWGQLGEPSDIPNPQLVQLCRGKPGELLLWVGVPPAPNYGPAVSLFAPVIPLCTKVEANKGYAGKLRAVLPLAEWNQYDGPIRSGPDIVREPVYELRLVVEHAFHDETYYAEPDSEHPLAWKVRSEVALHRAEARESIAELGLELCIRPGLQRFA